MGGEIDPDKLSAARRLLSAASRVTVLTGAGVSAESGIPTYRGAGGGLWDGLSVEQWATPEGFARDPQRVWKWYSDRRVQLGEVRPNPAHFALAELQRRLARRGGKLTLVTQNIDALHQAAGSEGVLELHGSLRKIRCTRCAYAADVGCEPIEELPACPRCASHVRPAVVWFGEALPPGIWEAAVEAAQNCDVFLAVGTSAAVYPAAGLVELAVGCGAQAIEVNVEATALSSLAAVALRGAAGEVLPGLVE
jgi:NAD-dependent deacetylase